MMLLREGGCLALVQLPELVLLEFSSGLERFLSRLDLKVVGPLAVGLCGGFLGCF